MLYYNIVCTYVRTTTTTTTTAAGRLGERRRRGGGRRPGTKSTEFRHGIPTAYAGTARALFVGHLSVNTINIYLGNYFSSSVLYRPGGMGNYTVPGRRRP